MISRTREAMSDKGLSWGARSLYLYLDGRGGKERLDVMVADLEKLDHRPQARHDILSAMKELEEAGYIDNPVRWL